MGYSRVYVHCGEKLTPDSWWEGLRAGRVVVTWRDVPEFRFAGTGRRQTFQLVLHQDGRIEFHYAAINLSDIVVGIVPGRLQGDAAAVDFSEAMLARAIERTGCRGVDFWCVDAELLVDRIGDEEPFDLVVANATVQWFDDPLRTMPAQ